MNFFINGFPTIKNNNYYFSFLYENNTDQSYSIQFISSENIKLLNNFVELKKNGVYLDFIEICLHDEIKSKTKIPYLVYSNSNNRVVYEGSIILINQDEEDVKILYSSCNMTCFNGMNEKYIKKNRYSKYSNHMIVHLSQNIDFDVWIQLGDNIYEGLFEMWRARQLSTGENVSEDEISTNELIEIQKDYYRNTYNDPYQGKIMRNCINYMIQDNNEFYSKLGSSVEFSEKNPLFKKYFEIILENIIKRYTIYLFNEKEYFSDNYSFNTLTNSKFSKLVKIGKHQLLFHNNIYNFYKHGYNLGCEIFFATEKYLKLDLDNYYINMSRCLENYDRTTSQILNSELYESNTLGSSYDLFIKYIELLDSNPKNKIIFGGNNHFYFLKNYGKDDKIYDICTSSISSDSELEDITINYMSILNSEKNSTTKVLLHTKELNTFNVCTYNLNEQKLTFIEYLKSTKEFKYYDYIIF